MGKKYSRCREKAELVMNGTKGNKYKICWGHVLLARPCSRCFSGVLFPLYRGTRPREVTYLPSSGSKDVKQGSLAPEHTNPLNPPAPKMAQKATGRWAQCCVWSAAWGAPAGAPSLSWTRWGGQGDCQLHWRWGMRLDLVSGHGCCRGLTDTCGKGGPLLLGQVNFR